MKVIPRHQYASKIDSWLGKELIIVLIGQRRIGKSFVLRDFVIRHQSEQDANIIYIDMEKQAFRGLRKSEDLGAFIAEHYVAGKHNYILIDEVQDIDGWEHVVRSYRTEDNTDIIITGSNSKMLSSELSTLLGGRYKEIYIQGLSYLEFLDFHNLPDTDESLWKYLNYGGLPGLRAIGLDDEEMVREYLAGIVNTVILKDIVQRHSIRNMPFLFNLLNFLADTEGKLTSASGISRFMKSQRVDVSTNVVLDYMSFFAESYLINMVNRFDIHGKRLLESNSKCYFGDVGLRNSITGGERVQDIEKLLENIVYQHLLRLGFTVHVGQLRAGEIDFVCSKSATRAYVQVSYLIENEETRKREFGSLHNIKDDYPKFVISASPLISTTDYQGITHLPIRLFLKNGLGL